MNPIESPEPRVFIEFWRGNYMTKTECGFSRAAAEIANTIRRIGVTVWFE